MTNKKLSVFKRDIWNEKFSSEDNGGGIYKIYFEGHPNNCYIGMTTENSGFKKRLQSHKNFIWKINQGVSARGSLTREGGVKQIDYRKIDESDIKKWNQIMHRSRLIMIEDFCEDYIQPGDSKYIKMIYFMNQKGLSINDLRFEIILREEEIGNKKLFDVEHQLIEKNECWTKGFNATAMSEFAFGGVGKPDNVEPIKRMIRIVNNEIESDDFTKWNCWWNLYQSFKFNFGLNKEGWLEHWNKVTRKTLVNSFISQLDFLKWQERDEKFFVLLRTVAKSTAEFNKKNGIENDKWLEVILQCNNWKDLIKNHSRDELIEDLKNEYIKILDNKKQNSWQYFNIYGSYEQVNDFFKKNKFNNTRSFNSLITNKMVERLLDIKNNYDSQNQIKFLINKIKQIIEDSSGEETQEFLSNYLETFSQLSIKKFILFNMNL